MLKFQIFIFFIITSSYCWSHKAHSHSAGRMNLAFDGNNGVIELELPAPVLINFEHRPKTPVQKMKLEKALESLKTSIDQIIVFDPSLSCKSLNPESQVIYSGKKETHSEFKLTVKMECLKTPQLSDIRIPALKTYPKLEKIDIQTLIGDGQKSFILKGNQDTLN